MEAKAQSPFAPFDSFASHNLRCQCGKSLAKGLKLFWNQVYQRLAWGEADGRTVTRNGIHAPTTGESGWGVTSRHAGGGRISARPAHILYCGFSFSPVRASLEETKNSWLEGTFTACAPGGRTPPEAPGGRCRFPPQRLSATSGASSRQSANWVQRVSQAAVLSFMQVRMSEPPLPARQAGA